MSVVALGGSLMMGNCMALGLLLGVSLLLGFWGAVGTAAFVLRHSRHEVVLSATPQRRPVEAGRAEAVLRERFAHGEIDQAEYEKRRKVLAEPEPAWPDLG